MKVSRDFFHDVMFSGNVTVVEKTHEEPGVHTTVLYVFDGATRIAVLERTIDATGTQFALVEGIYEMLEGKI